MLLHYFKVVWRALNQNLVYSLVNLGGLSLGLTVAMLIMLYVQDDYSFDRFHKNGASLYRLVQNRQDPGAGEINRMGNTGMPQGPIFKAEVPEIQDFCRLKNGWNTIVKKGNDGIEEKLMYADNALLTMFSFPAIAGNTAGALNKLENVVITDRIAEKYFGSENAVGQTMYIGDEGGEFKPFVVAAVVKNPPSNSSIQFDLLLSIEHLVSTDPAQRARDENWHNANLNTFIQMSPQAELASVLQKLDQVKASHLAQQSDSNKGASKADQSISFVLQPFFQMHLDPEYYATNGLENWSDAQYPKILSVLAFIVLLIACINFINLSLARSLKRTKEIGIRKATGGTRTQLMVQFMGESLLMALLAFIPAFALTYAVLPAFSDLMEKHLAINYLWQPQTLGLFGALLIIVTLLSGLYPAMVLSAFQPIQSLKGEFSIGRRLSFGKVLLVLQFVAAGVLMLGTGIASRQFDYIANANLGYKTENILRFWLPWEQIGPIAPQIKNELAQIPFVEKVSAKSGDWNSTKYDIDGTKTDWVYYEHIDENHLQLMGIPLASGRYLSSKYMLDTVSNILVNESFVRQYLPESKDPFTSTIRQRNLQMHIVGIVKDFHYASFKEKIKPMVWALDRGTQAGCLHVQISAKHQNEALAAIQAVYKKHVPYLPMEYHFLEDFRMERYAEDLRWKQLLDYTSFIAICIACLGLFGLAAFMMERRTKEIGVRKVLGASVAGITGLLARDFLKLVLIAIIISSPIAYHFMNKWLADFAYRIDIQWWMFVVAGAGALAVATFTVAIQSVRAALANPVESLRSE
ncbi:MAG: FtsX-like permease family protein [Saprospiraceae bacterium]